MPPIFFGWRSTATRALRVRLVVNRAVGHHRPFEPRVREINARQVRPVKIGMPQVRALEVGALQIGILQGGAGQVRAREVGPFEVGVGKRRAPQVRVCQIRPSRFEPSRLARRNLEHFRV